MSDDGTKFARLTIEGWRQFSNVDIELHPALTVITGTNGAGKSTLLNIFSQHFGFHRPLLATPQRDKKSGGYRYFSGAVRVARKLFGLVPRDVQNITLGQLVYTNGEVATAQIPREGGIQYHLSLLGQQNVPGFHVPSHRRLINYQQVGQIPTQPMLPEQAYSHFFSEVSSYFNGGNSGYSTIYRVKESLLSMAIFGPGSQYVQKNDVILDAFNGFISTLKVILPEEIGFVDISIRPPEVVLITKSGEFLIDAASGGVAALIDLSWQIYIYSLAQKSFVVTIDEPENHLHPSMQRSLMSNLIRAFPQVQFIVATHSPFIVSALKEARVYVLRYQDHEAMSPEQDSAESMQAGNRTRSVSTLNLDSMSRAGTASQILRDVLGLETTYPEWVGRAVDDIVAKYRGRPFDQNLVKQLRVELEASGYGELYPDALAKVLHD
jgi:hypothetical protein